MQDSVNFEGWKWGSEFRGDTVMKWAQRFATTKLSMSLTS